MKKSKNQTKYSIQEGNDGEVNQFLTPFQRKLLGKSKQEDLPELYRQRIEIMLLADEGKTQTEICQTLECSPATARHWMHIARSGMAHQWQDCPIGRPKAINEEYLERLKELLAHTPRDYGYSFGRWTVNWLNKHLTREFGIQVSDRHLKRLLKKMGLSTKPKPETSEQQKDSKSLFIDDLKSVRESKANSLWLFNPNNRERKNGSKYI